MTPLIVVVGFIFANAVVGAMVLTSVDRDGRLFAWYHEAPSVWLKVAVLELWPVVLVSYFRGFGVPRAKR